MSSWFDSAVIDAARAAESHRRDVLMLAADVATDDSMVPDKCIVEEIESSLSGKLSSLRVLIRYLLSDCHLPTGAFFWDH